jgi:hypothetical protein
VPLYGTRRFITEFTRALHLHLSWARPTQSKTFTPISKRSILMLSIHLRLGLPSGLFPSGFPTNNLYQILNTNTNLLYLVVVFFSTSRLPLPCKYKMKLQFWPENRRFVYFVACFLFQFARSRTVWATVINLLLAAIGCFVSLHDSQKFPVTRRHWNYMSSWRTRSL